ncbi:peptidase MA family metallohydrolase [Kribbella speibonae]|uniref:Peptidase MA-like domain-containing protein n=1 Tax=Kribbella speibonae TaxID=1572660 RepID=A0ABY1ZXQ2_9ACTN|nr:hypothetical protein [Kribbella speibonae]TCC18030.1 hypothetical protein E0H58_34960 [Kribbella speibonae]
MTTDGARPTRGRRWTAVAAVLAIAAAATTWAVAGRDDPPASSSAATPTPTVSEQPVEERMLAGAGAILKTRATAVLTGRLSQYLQYVDPANKKLRERDQQVFANLRKLGLARLSYQVDANWAPEVQAQHGPSARAVRVLMLIQVAGIDAAPRATGLGYTFAERDGRWLLVDDDDLAAEADLKAYREPWDLGAIEVVRRPGVVVVAPVGERPNAERLAHESQAAIPIVRSTTRRVQAGILVIAMADNRSMDPEWRTGGHPAAAVAAHNFAPANPEASEFKVVGSRVVINPDQRTRAGRLLLAHEFTHAAMGLLGNSAPTWLVEGFAMYVENRLAAQNGYEQELAAERRTLLREKVSALVVLPIDGVFHGDYDEDSYGVSWIIVEYLVTKYGQAAVNSLYADLARGPDAPAVREQVLRKHLKLSETALVAALKKYDGPS